MPDASSEPTIVTLESTEAAVLRATVAATALPEFFDRAYHAVADALERQGVGVAGPPMGVYHGMPGETVDVAAGFPTERTAVDAGDVTAVTLPGGRAAQVLHTGSYDDLADTYGRLVRWLGERGATPGPLMWESYLTEPQPGGDQSGLKTLITWPLAD